MTPRPSSEQSPTVSGSSTGRRTPPSRARAGVTRLTVDLPTDDAQLLVQVAEETHYNRTTTLVRAVRLLADLLRVAREDDGQILLLRKDGTRERLLLR